MGKEKEELIYGYVVVTGGEHKGKVGLYDNDEDGLCAVYFGIPFFEPETWIEEKYLQNTEATNERVEAYADVKLMYSGLAAMKKLLEMDVKLDEFPFFRSGDCPYCEHVWGVGQGTDYEFDIIKRAIKK